MTRLGAVMSEAIVHHYGRDELLRRLAHPFWFQSFGAVMGMDWHSSGVTTSVMGALKRGLAPLSDELGIHVCGGRGKHSRQTPQELVSIGERVGFDGSALATASRLVAKVDSAAVQDGFDLYLHGFIVTNDRQWVVIQQGMNGDRKQARMLRYHWLSEGLKSFVEEPHSAIDGVGQGEIVNLTDRRAEASRRSQLDVLQYIGPRRDRARIVGPGWPVREARQSDRFEAALSAAFDHAGPSRRSPKRRSSDAFTPTWRQRRIRGPSDFAELLLRSGGGSADRARAGDGRRGRAWRTLPFHRPSAFFVCARREGSASVSCSASGFMIKRIPGAKICCPEREAWSRGDWRR